MYGEAVVAYSYRPQHRKLEFLQTAYSAVSKISTPMAEVSYQLEIRFWCGASGHRIGGIMKGKLLHIAIDGPVASGKGTAAKILASRLGILYVDTGVMYRAAALLAKRKGVAWIDGEGIARLVEEADLNLRAPTAEEQDGRMCTVILNGEDISWEIRTEEMSQGSSKVAVHEAVRRAMVEKQQEMAKQQSLVMEGRDIALRVLPQATLKIYLTADLKERARRRREQLLARGEDVPIEDIEREIAERDNRDMTRKVDPLMKVPDAWELDTTGLSITETADLIEKRVREIQENIIDKRS